MGLFLRNVIILARPHQYIKNIIIILPVFFHGAILNRELLISASIAFVAFSLSASGIYILNDYFDIEKDRLHPKKKNRPMAAGTISVPVAFIVMIILFMSGGVLMALLSLEALGVLGIYVILNIGYSIKLKQIAILDVSFIAIGFVLRLFIGSAVTFVPLSKWIVIMVFLLALFMALGKRRDDVLVFLNTGKKMRRVIDGYNIEFLNGAMMLLASVVIVAYIMYTTSSEIIQQLQSDYVYLTTIFVVLGILRYLQITLVLEDSGDPTKIVLRDRFMHLTIIGWIGSFVWILYIPSLCANMIVISFYK